MPKSTADLVKKLIMQFNGFTEQSAAFGAELQGVNLTFLVSLSYSTLRFDIYRSEILYFRYACQAEENSGAALAEFYYHDTDKIEILKKHFESLVFGDEETLSGNISGALKYTEDLNKYLAMAESIAACAYLCAAGDDYRPGYFSEIVVKADGIVLKQINHMNSRSRDHKQDYSLRDLEFNIPLIEVPEQKPLDMDDDHIGIMRIHFSDRSSENNKVCGERIREKIEEEKNFIAR